MLGHMRKFGIVALALLMVVSLFAIGGCASDETEEGTETETEAAATEESTEEAAEPAGDVALAISGAIDAPVDMTMADVEALGVVTKTVEHPKKGEVEYEGVLLSSLITEIGAENASALVFKASDGYEAEVALADILASEDSMLEIDEEGKLNVVLPTQPTSAWVGDTVAIEVK